MILKQVDLDLVDHGACQSRLRQTKLGRFFRLGNSFVCAGGGEGVDTCKGDGGGPLVCPVRDPATGRVASYVQVGVVAWGVECGTSAPGVYAAVGGDGMCFLELAAACAYDGDAGWAGFSGAGLSGRCQGWFRERVRSLRETRDSLRWEKEHTIWAPFFVLAVSR